MLSRRISTFNFGCILLSLTIMVLFTLEKCSGSIAGSWTRDFNCYDLNNIGYIGNIPHPSDCSHFLSCVQRLDGYVSATVMSCGVDGLVYNMDGCSCDWPESTQCFQQGNSDHELNRFKCAEPMQT